MMHAFIRRTLKGRSPLYWVLSVLAIIAGIVASYLLEENYVWIETRYHTYQVLQWFLPHPPEPQETVLVMIGDDEYWTGDLAQRIRRDYLARVVTALETCNPSVIALDFDLRSPKSDGSMVDNKEYACETLKFVDTVSEVSKKCPIVLPATINYADENSPYSIDSAVYGNLPFSKSLRRGFIDLPYDIRRIPSPQEVDKKQRIDSFAVAIMRARGKPVPKDAEKSDILPFGTFISPADWAKRSLVLPVSELLKGNCGSLRANIAIVGGAWHNLSHNNGDVIDEYLTPAGLMGGAFIHANYVEALIAGNVFPPLNDTASRAIEVTAAAVFAFLLAVRTNRTYRKAGILITGCLLLFFITYVAWRNFGYYFDFFFPVIFLLAHAFGEYYLELRRDAIAFRSKPN
jgi:hypothetical protein